MKTRLGTKAFRLLCMVACLAVALPLLSQAGHPAKGSWSGDWGPTEDHRNRILLLLDWDGNEITGTINPGPNAIEIERAELDPVDMDPYHRGDGACRWRQHRALCRNRYA